ncbi:hypothetical protein KXD40_008140 [Peronospora effusa]|uniref:FYVE-type domain-containing protein n=1 Tax=Peronospora effusa TaxID=542832 RepID=A0A3M6VPT4_9STRA|nr:hypothetical protein DD238_008000 [Peronospora effusa]RQM12599.1 hypothetical protein DD237_004163 [Peronospora effusa]UIZ24061.1 hypothetical protein KXD40_008140 [Peronospora effusa]CAI5714452.1 unnamed protein product [Peronospora effusa]
MLAIRNYGTPWSRKSCEGDLSRSVAASFVAMMGPSNSYDSVESSATCDFVSQRSDDGYGNCSSSRRRRDLDVETMGELTRLSDKRLHEVAAAAASGVNWGELELELAAANLSDSHGSVWKRKKFSRGYTNSNAMKLFTRLTVRDHRHQTRWGPKGFAVLAEEYVSCTVQELRLLFRVASTDAFRDMMSCMYRRDFVDGELLRTIKIQHEAGNPAKAYEDRELSVKSATFGSRNVFSRNSSWCFLELLHPRDRVKEEQPVRRTASSAASAISATPRPAFTRTLVSIARSGVVLNNAYTPSSRSHSHVPNVVINYSFEQAPSGCFTRVVFHGEYLPPDAHDAFKRASHERRRARIWMLRLAASCHRYIFVVQRRRLGMQVIINSTRLLLDTMAKGSCACCRRSFSTFLKRTRRRLCCLCGFLVCEKCASVQEREHRARGDDRPQVEQVRVCERCLIRMHQAQYKAVTEEDLRPARVISDAQSPISRAYSAPDGNLYGIDSRRTRSAFKTRPASLNDLLLEILAEATAGGPAQRRRKASVLSVMKDIVEEERARRQACSARIRSASAGATTSGLPLLGARSEKIEDADEYVDVEPVNNVERLKLIWGEAPRWEDDYPLANADSRRYQIRFPDDEMEAIVPPTPANEYQRLQIIHEQQLNKLGDVPELGIICSLASKELSCAVSTITVVDKTELHVLASTHPTAPSGRSYPREQGFCAQTILDRNPLVSRHVQADVRFNALISVRKMGINFYCGFPLVGSDGKTVIGSLCCADPQARDLTQSQYASMSSLASAASRIIQRAAKQRAVRENSNEA